MLHADPVVMAAIFHALVHLVLVGAAFCQLLLVLWVIGPLAPRRAENVMRAAAAVAGLVLYLGAKAIGVSVPAFLLQAMTMSGAYLTGLLGTLIPAAVGFLLAWYVTGYLGSRDARRDDIGMRVMVLTLVITFFLYTDLYVASLDVASAAGLSLLLPNITFTLSVLLYAVLRFHPLQQEEPPAPQHSRPAE
jgi:hypothetical protein